MKRRLLIALTSVSLLVGVVAAPALATPYGPARYQVTTNTYTMFIGFNHTYTVVMNPCNGGSATASGWQWGSDGNPAIHNPDETITATVSPDGLWLTFKPAVYVGGWGGSPYSWSGTFPVAGGMFTVTDSLGGVYTNVQITRTSTTPTAFRNHGEYVAAKGGGADAAHSCIGMPIKPANQAAGASGPERTDVAAILAANASRLLATLEDLLARLQGDGHASLNATVAIKKHVDAITGGTSGLDRAANAVGKTHASAKAAKPVTRTLPAKAQNHPNAASHPGKP